MIVYLINTLDCLILIKSIICNSHKMKFHSFKLKNFLYIFYLLQYRRQDDYCATQFNAFS